MRSWMVGAVLLAIACGFAALIRAADEQAETIFKDAEAHELKRGVNYKKTFTAQVNPAEVSLLFDQKMEQQSSGGYWNVSLNGKALGRLEAHRKQHGSDASYDGFHHLGLAVPADTLKAGENTLAISGNGQVLVLKNIQLINRPLQETMQMGTVHIKIDTQGKESAEPVPARVTVVDQRGQLVKLYQARTPKNAVRPGILYTLGTGDSFALPAGKYTLYVTRGMEWSVAKKSLEVKGNESQNLTLELKREVDTTGFVACDSHIHTLPGSGHGNATFQERMITIAGEGIEVAVATDHNHISDYAPHQHATGTHTHFHSISGDEVTTHNGHFTAFPLDAAKAVPGGVQGRNPLFLKEEDWTKLIADMRVKGAEVVVLNHPYWPTIPKGPFGQFRFDRKTAERLAGPEFTFDGIEVAQPANETPDLYYALEDWLALLNRGTRLTAVGATDSHTVNDPVGQARTYLKSRSDDVAEIDRKDVYAAFVEGRASVAAGIFATLSIDKRFGMGDLVPGPEISKSADRENRQVNAQLRIATAAWIHPREAMIYVNGQLVEKRELKTEPDQPTDQTLEFSISLPEYDAHVVAFVLGDPITLPGWTTYDRPTQAITNPIYLDLDNDKRYSSPREIAQRMIAEKMGTNKQLTQAEQTELLDSLSGTQDAPVLLHAKSLLQEMQ